jgi:hypothetical protein
MPDEFTGLEFGSIASIIDVWGKSWRINDGGYFHETRFERPEAGLGG